MTLRQLEYIIEVAEQGSISVAARKLMISQPSLSQGIRSIEKEYNVTLFTRGSGPLVPTKAGAILLKKAHVILTALEDIKKEIALVEHATEELLIGISDSGAIINRIIFRDFQKRYPDVKLMLVEREQLTLERMLEAGKLSMIFTMIPNENPNLTVIPLVEDEMLVALPRSHPVSCQCVLDNPDMLDEKGKQRYFPFVDLADCKDVRYVLSGRDRLKVAQLAALRSSFEPEIGFETDTLASAVSISAYEPHGTIVPQLFSTLYDGPDRPFFFHGKGKMPIWNFTLSLQKEFHLSAAALYYIKLFIGYIDHLGLLTNNILVDDILGYLKKEPTPKNIQTL